MCAFLNIALGSLYELDTQYEIAVRVHNTQYQEEAQKAMEEVKKMIIGCRNYLIK
jgi:four helix bundle protein